jgi:hypothetical protein
MGPPSELLQLEEDKGHEIHRVCAGPDRVVFRAC